MLLRNIAPINFLVVPHHLDPRAHPRRVPHSRTALAPFQDRQLDKEPHAVHRLLLGQLVMALQGSQPEDRDVAKLRFGVDAWDAAMNQFLLFLVVRAQSVFT